MAGKRDTDPVAAFFAKAAEAVVDVSRGAMTDIRHELVERPWFGREVTGDRPMHEQLGWSEPGAKAEAWDALCHRLGQERGRQPEPLPEPDYDLEW